MTLTTLNTIHTLLTLTHDSIKSGYVSEGWVPEPNIFNTQPLTSEQAAEMNAKHDRDIETDLDIANRLLNGEEVVGYLDTDY